MDARSYLFVPGNRPERFERALASGADAVVLDLEDAVAADAKPAARDAIARWAAAAPAALRARVLVRINDVASPAFDEDLRLLREAALNDVMLPKAEHDDALAAVRATQPAARLLPLVETAAGVWRCEALAAGAGVVRVVFGTLDYALDLDLDIEADPEPLADAAARLVLASRIAGRLAPVAGVTPQIDDEHRLIADWRWARRRGFGAKLCIHPKQVAPLHLAMQPAADDIAWAQRVLAAEAASPGAAKLDGRMIDRPVVLQAERTLRRAAP